MFLLSLAIEIKNTMLMAIHQVKSGKVRSKSDATFHLSLAYPRFVFVFSYCGFDDKGHCRLIPMHAHLFWID